MNFSGISPHGPEIGVRQPKVYGDIQNQLIKLVGQQKTQFICHAHFLIHLIMYFNFDKHISLTWNSHYFLIINANYFLINLLYL